MITFYESMELDMPKAIAFIPHKTRVETHKVAYLRAISESMDDPYQTEDGREMRGVQLQLAEKCKSLSGIKHWQFTDCCTDAIQISIDALTNPGDTVIIPSYGWRAFGNAVRFMNRKIRFCDVDATGNIDVEKLHDMIPKVKPAAVIIVHNFGTIVDINKIIDTCKQHRVKIIEDAAPSFYMGEPYSYVPGSLSDTACFSFDFTKYPGTLGSGGAICTNSDSISKTIYEISAHGRGKDKDIHRVGTKSYMDMPSCAVLYKEIELFETLKYRERRREIADWYKENLPYSCVPGENFIWERYTMSVPKDEVEEVIEKLNSVKCLARTFFKEPLHLLPWLNTDNDDCPNTTKFCETTVHLPSHHYLHNDELYRIKKAL